MVEFDELRLTLVNMKSDLEMLGVAIGIDKVKAEIERLEKQTADESFWQNMEEGQKTLKLLKNMKDKLLEYETLCKMYDDAFAFVELCIEFDDESELQNVKKAVEDFEKEYEKQKLSTLLSGEYDNSNAIITFHAGAGGTEAQDWAEMLYRMYTRFAERSGFDYKILDYTDGDEAGIKSASILIEGQNAYGFLKSEAGIHRLVRVSPFDSSGRRHTSFASVDVMPEIDDSVEVDIKPDDIKVDTYRSSGAGGQKVNKTDSAVRITHIPTGIVCACQVERSQHQNREVAMRMLRSKLIEIKEREHLEKIEDIRGTHKDIAWGSQIRSYVFMPYTLAKDHRTDYEMGNINAVMDGEIDGFINAYLQMENHKKIGKAE